MTDQPSLWDLVESEHERLIAGELAVLKPWQRPGVDYAPNRVRTDDYDTSKAGAASIAYRAGSQKARLLVAYQAAGWRGLTDEEAAEAAGLPVRSCYWKRCNEMRDAGVIVQTGDERVGRAGVPRIVCRTGD